MDDLIRRQDALKVSSMDSGIYIGINNLQPVDAVEVVRCKDCRFYFFVEGEDRGECDERIDSFRPFYPNDFCSYGERKDNE